MKKEKPRSSGFKTLIVGVDFSDYSKIVARQAFKIAKSLNAKLVLVNALSSATYGAGEAMFYTPTDDEFDSIAAEVRSFYKTHLLHRKPEIIVQFGAPAELIVRVAKREDRPLIVVGHRGQSKIRRFFLGSNAEELALKSPFPVWVQRGSSVLLPSKILIPCDFSSRTAKSLAVVMELENGRGGSYEFYHVKERPIPILDASTFKRAQRETENFEANSERHLRILHPEIPIKSVTGKVTLCIARESAKFDLIAMAPHNRKGLFANFGSVTAKVVRRGEVPILITH